MRLAGGAIAVLAIGIATAAIADETVCTPEYYYNTSEATPLIIAIDAPRLAGSRITRIDLDTGAYSERIGTADGYKAEGGKMKIVNPGSLKERIDFIGLDTKSGLVLHISLIDEGMPFTRVDTDGTVASGHCAYEGDLPK